MRPVTEAEMFNGTRFLYSLLDTYDKCCHSEDEDEVEELVERAEALHEVTSLEEIVAAAYVGYQSLMVFMDQLRRGLPDDSEEREDLSATFSAIFQDLVAMIHWAACNVGKVPEGWFEQQLFHMAASSTRREYMERARDSQAPRPIPD